MDPYIRKIVTSALAAACSACMAGAAPAQTLDLSWGTCSPIVTDRTPIAGGELTVIASVFGQSQAHQAYEVWWVIGDAGGGLPDAWRFDDAGCNAGLYEFTTEPPSAIANVCPPLVSAASQPFTIELYQLAPAGLGFPTTMGSGFLAVSYPNGSTNTNPAARYHVAGFRFNLAASVTGPSSGSGCGGLETPMTLRLVPSRVNWLDLSGVEHPWWIGNSTLTLNGGAGGAAAQTWGQIKGQYRR